MDSSCFRGQLQTFPDAVAIDLPGHGSPGSAESIDEFSHAVERYINDNGLADVVLCGHSMGGAIALSIALARRIEPKACVLFGSGARLRVDPAILAGLESDFESTICKLVQLFFAKPTAEDTDWALQHMRAVGSTQLLRDFRACDGFDVLERLPELSLPLLAITGESDRLTPPKYASAFASRVPGAQARIIGGAGHLVMLERPAETNTELSAFLHRLPLRS